jgi:hypothetical protein
MDHPLQPKEMVMEICAGSERSGKGASHWFTGTVRIDPLRAGRGH